MSNVRVLFLGASRLVGLLRRFVGAASEVAVNLEMFSIENDARWHAIAAAGLAITVPGPAFSHSEFQPWLLEKVREYEIDIVIPNIDSATVALSRVAEKLGEIGILAMVSDHEVCESMADKAKSDGVFRALGLRVPDGESYPLLAKPRFGASSRGIATLNDATELAFWRRRNRSEEFFFQPFVEGREFSLDAYVDGTGRTLGIVSRERIVVSGGEAMVTRTEHQHEAIAMVERLLRWKRWFGPLTVQVIDDGQQVWLLECNPRFGSGVTCSIEAGLRAPEWILSERLGLPLPKEPITWHDGLCLTRSREDHFLWLS